jgi:hypothetical protein
MSTKHKATTKKLGSAVFLSALCLSIDYGLSVTILFCCACDVSLNSAVQCSAVQCCEARIAFSLLSSYSTRLNRSAWQADGRATKTLPYSL